MGWLSNFVFKVVCLNWEPFYWLIGEQCYIWGICIQFCSPKPIQELKLCVFNPMIEYLNVGLLVKIYQNSIQSLLPELVESNSSLSAVFTYTPKGDVKTYLCLLLWVELCPPKRYVKIQVPMNVTLFGNRVFPDVINLRWGHIRLGRILVHWLVSLLEEGNLDTETGRIPYDNGGRRQSDASTNHRVTKIASNHLTLGRGNERTFPRTFR